MHCGAPLPESPRPVDESELPPPIGEGSGIGASEASLDLGDGRRVVISDVAVEIRGERAPSGGRIVAFPGAPLDNVMGQSAPDRLLLNRVRAARLEHRRMWPAIGLAGISGLLCVVLPWWPARIVALVALAAAVFAFVRTRFYVVRFEQTTGEPAWLVLGGGSFGSTRGVRAHAVWVDLAQELERRGVRVEVPR